MKIHVIGNNECARTLRCRLLTCPDVSLVDEKADYTINIKAAHGTEVIVDSIDCDLERNITSQMRENGVPRFTIQSEGGIQSDRAIEILYPHIYQEAVANGIYQGLCITLDGTGRDRRKNKRRASDRVEEKIKWLNICILVGIIILIALFAVNVHP